MWVSSGFLLLISGLNQQWSGHISCMVSIFLYLLRGTLWSAYDIFVTISYVPEKMYILKFLGTVFYSWYWNFHYPYLYFHCISAPKRWLKLLVMIMSFSISTISSALYRSCFIFVIGCIQIWDCCTFQLNGFIIVKYSFLFVIILL